MRKASNGQERVESNFILTQTRVHAAKGEAKLRRPAIDVQGTVPLHRAGGSY